jgi:hypothetical protein
LTKKRKTLDNQKGELDEVCERLRDKCQDLIRVEKERDSIFVDMDAKVLKKLNLLHKLDA